MEPELKKEPYGPLGDPARHRSLETLERVFATMPGGPKDRGSVKLLVARGADGERSRPASAELNVEEGMTGDGWSRRLPRDLRAQITVMRYDVAELIANGQPLSIFGDNVFVDLDLSEQNLPAGSRLRVGGCIVDVTAEPHRGCGKFGKRFGNDALRFTNLRPLREQKLRGIHWRVVESGMVRVGDAVEVLSRGDNGS